MKNQIVVNGRQFATNNENEGVFELVNGAYMQHRGNGQAGPFKSTKTFRQYVVRMLK
jgi:hypothetical protein